MMQITFSSIGMALQVFEWACFESSPRMFLASQHNKATTHIMSIMPDLQVDIMGLTETHQRNNVTSEIAFINDDDANLG